MATLKEIADAHGTGTIHMPSGTIENEADYDAKVVVEGVTKLSWSALQTEIGKVAYIEKRAAEYPSFADQFDLIYHSGVDAWKAKIKETKDKYPKE